MEPTDLAIAAAALDASTEHQDHAHEAGKRKPYRFQPGVAANPKGRTPGPNKVTIEAREAAAEIVDNPAYRAKLLDRALKGKLPPPVEALLWHYAKGVPKQQLDINQRVTDVSKMATDDLKGELAELLAKL